MVGYVARNLARVFGLMCLNIHLAMNMAIPRVLEMLVTSEVYANSKKPNAKAMEHIGLELGLDLLPFSSKTK